VFTQTSTAPRRAIRTPLDTGPLISGQIAPAHAVECLRASPVAMLTTDRTGVICFANAAACRLTGRDSKDLPGLPLRELFCWEDRPGLRAHIRSVENCGDAAQGVYTLERPDGGLLSCELESRLSGESGGATTLLHTLDEASDNRAQLQRLQRYQRETEGLFQAAELCLAVLDAQGRIRRINPAGLEMLGLGPHTAIGVPFAECLFEPFRTGLSEQIRLWQLGEGAPEKMHVCFCSSDGVRRSGLLTCHELCDEEDRPEALSLSLVDLTERLEVEQHRRLNEENYRLLFENSPAAILVASPEGRILAANRTSCRLLDLPEEDLIGLDLGPFYQDPEDRSRLRADLEQAAVLRDRVVPMRSLGGRPFLLRTQVHRTHWDGQPAFFVNAEDITEIRRSQEQIEQSQARFHALAAGAMDLICQLDAGGKLVYVNAACEEILGCPPRYLIGDNFLDWVHHDDRRWVGFRLRGMACHNATALVEYRLRRADGSIIWVESSCRAIHPPQGESPGEMVLVTRDVSERKRSQQLLLDSQKRLRSLAARMAVLEEKQRREIASGLHDRIGQSLAGLKLQVGLLGRELEDPAQVRTLREVGEELATVMKDVWSLTFELCPPLLYEVGLVAAVEKKLEGFSDRYGIEVKLEIDGHQQPIPEDVRGLVFRVIGELLANVAKHSGATGVRVKLQYGPREFACEVIDDGRGIPPEKRNQIGRPRDDGGFGLFNVRERLGDFGGRLDLDSRPGEGARVIIRLPLPEENDDS
jgi:PAS domain S-box-containing protein